MIEIKAPNWVPDDGFKVFLAGSIDMGAAIDWQKEVAKGLEDIQELIILNPRRDDWDSSWVQDISDPKFNEQVTWEMNNIEEADLVLFYFDPNGKAPITLLELGLVLGGWQKAIVCCPKGYWRRGNVQIACARNYVPLVETLEELIACARGELL